jgi:hypothetical protein
MRRLHIQLLAAVIAVGLMASPAFAGPVQVFTDWARGDMGTAHNATNGQYIGCWLDSDTVGPPLLYCEAYDGSQVSFCFSTNSNLITVSSTMTSLSDIEFGWNDDHTCSFLMINTFSQPPGRRFP